MENFTGIVRRCFLRQQDKIMDLDYGKCYWNREKMLRASAGQDYESRLWEMLLE
jgi:hypothetical protein